MRVTELNSDLLEYLMDRIDGATFERFAKQIFSAIYGEEFVPLGGIHDGGADAVLSSFIQQVSGKPNSYVQFSITAGDPKGKIKETIAALKKVGREPRQVIYATNQKLPKQDIIVAEIHDEEEGVLVGIRDFERLRNYLNINEPANAAFYTFFTDEITSLSKAATLKLSAVTKFAADPTIYVFLNHELRDRFTQDKLNNRVLDALIYWSLRDTDPDKAVFLIRADIFRVIENAFPVAKNVLLGNLDTRLETLSQPEAGLERIRYYKKGDKFCLPFEMRTQLAVDASEALLLQERFNQSISARFIEACGSDTVTDKQTDLCCTMIFSTVHGYFVDQGLLLAAFLEGKLASIEVSDQIVEDTLVIAYSESKSKTMLSSTLFGSCMAVLRGIFYRSSESERAYMRYLSRTSCLLVTMNSAPKLLEYFNQMGGNFRLIVGTDLIVKALSESLLEKEHQQVTNLLRAVAYMGSELILTEPVVTEVFTHLHAADLEFRNHYAMREQYLKDEDVAACDRIMIRAYLYARRSSKGPTTWRAYVNQFVGPDDLRGKMEVGKQALQGYLQQRFRMKYLSGEELTTSVPLDEVNKLASRLVEQRGRKHEDLSFNDALLAYAVYAERARHHESAIYDGFGFRTWWLTKETRVATLTGELVLARGGVPYIMRPEFLLNFVALAPKAAEARKALANLLPTTAGLQLGHHVSSDIVNALMNDTAEWKDLSPERVSVLLSQKVNLLTHTRFKQYLQNV